MSHQEIIDKTVQFVKEELSGAEGGHDWWHIYRVWKTSLAIAKTEKVDLLVVELGALLHDIADSKFHDGDESIGPKLAGDFMLRLSIEKDIIVHVQHVIENISFKGGKEAQWF
ncbi:MAG: phosphohydrolase, partial [Bacteroidetes bacterium HGW-Bacteroidetes-22]